MGGAVGWWGAKRAAEEEEGSDPRGERGLCFVHLRVLHVWSCDVFRILRWGPNDGPNDGCEGCENEDEQVEATKRSDEATRRSDEARWRDGYCKREATQWEWGKG
jgi:hypothetical protein